MTYFKKKKFLALLGVSILLSIEISKYTFEFPIPTILVNLRKFDITVFDCLYSNVQEKFENLKQFFKIVQI